jgi:hypothetical protein
MEEGEEQVLSLAFDAKVIQAALTGGKPVRFDRMGIRAAAKLPENRSPAPAKEVRVAMLIRRMAQKKPPEKRVIGQLCCAREIAASILLGFRKTQQLSPAPRGVPPDPAMNGSQKPVEARRLGGHRHNGITHGTRGERRCTLRGSHRAAAQ